MTAHDDIALHQVWQHREGGYRAQVVSYTGAGRNGHLTLLGLASQRHWTIRELTFREQYQLLDAGQGVFDIQLALDLGELTEPVYVPSMTLQERFEAFHNANPWVLHAYERLTADWLAKGNGRVGIKMLTEIIRWQYGRATTGQDFKINNNYPSRYVRLMLDRNPAWATVFHTRELRTA